MIKLICDETGKKLDVKPGETILIGTRVGSSVREILSREVVEAVPFTKRICETRGESKDGFDICCSRFPCDYPIESIDDIAVCGHHFSVDGETAKKYFPNHYERYFM